MNALAVRNRQRSQSLNLPLLREITRHLIEEVLALSSYSLALHIVRAREMATVNYRFLQHAGSTDVITFDYSDAAYDLAARQSNCGDNVEIRTSNTPEPAGIHGEIFICIDDATLHARRFRTTWQAELIRYVVHGILHLQGYDDLKPAARRRMKARENSVVKRLSKEFPIRKLRGTVSKQ